jgi:manganese-dependent ADP-ribose/CDP-alcohol diphosphatase
MITHVPLQGCDYLVWDFDEVMEILNNFTCVKAVFSGHYHIGSYVQDSKSVHHLTF